MPYIVTNAFPATPTAEHVSFNLTDVLLASMGSDFSASDVLDCSLLPTAMNLISVIPPLLITLSLKTSSRYSLTLLESTPLTTMLIMFEKVLLLLVVQYPPQVSQVLQPFNQVWEAQYQAIQFCPQVQPSTMLTLHTLLQNKQRPPQVLQTSDSLSELS